MIIDCFTFFNEMDLLEVRVHTLAPYVDAFVLAEANRTFQGAPKAFWFERPGVWKDPFGLSKPLYVVQADLAWLDDEKDAWQRESHQRRSLVDQLKTLSPNDRIILSDVDEIPLLGPSGQDEMYVLPYEDAIVSWRQDLFYYWVNMRCWRWIGPVSCTWRTLQSMFQCDLQALREYRHQAPLTIHGGWHFSFLGGADAIKTKIEAFSHTEYRWAADQANIEYALRERWKENRDLFGRLLPGMRFQVMPDDSHLPAYLVSNKERFKDWWYPHA